MEDWVAHYTHSEAHRAALIHGALGSGNAEAVARFGRQLTELYTQSREQQAERLALTPDDAQAWSCRAGFLTTQALAQRNNAAPARELLDDIWVAAERSLALNINQYQALLTRGWLQADFLRDPTAAIASYDNALRLCPFAPDPLNFRGVNRLRLGDPGGEQDRALAARLRALAQAQK